MNKSSKSIPLKKVVAQIVQDSQTHLTAADIAQRMLDHAEKYEYVEQLKEKEQDLDSIKLTLKRNITTLYCQGALHPLHISATPERPRHFYYDKLPAEPLADSAKSKEILREEKNEKDLYPKLMQFCKWILNIDTLRIDEKTSKRLPEKKNVWLHADIVGFEDLMSKFQEKETKDCVIEYSCERSLLYSFEVKDGMIDKGNLRRYFFQAVSNSSWANFSYLVAEDISEATKEELQLLCESFKIGFIKLNRDEPEESEIVIPAPKTSLDWNMMDRIAQANSDFRKYLDNISLAYKWHNDHNIRKPEWDSDKYSLNPDKLEDVKMFRYTKGEKKNGVN